MIFLKLIIYFTNVRSTEFSIYIGLFSLKKLKKSLNIDEKCKVFQ